MHRHYLADSGHETCGLDGIGVGFVVGFAGSTREEVNVDDWLRPGIFFERRDMGGESV